MHFQDHTLKTHFISNLVTLILFIVMLTVSQALPFNGITTKFSKDNYQEAYNMLFNYTDSKHLNRGINITRDNFKKGYTLFVFDLDAHVRSSDALPALKSGNLSLEVRLATALPWAGTLICYGKFPTQVQIDKSRSIIL